MIAITLPDGSKREYEAGTTVADVAASIGAGLAKATLAGKVDGRLVDASYPLNKNAALEIVTEKSPEALDVLRHSTAHLLAQAVQRLYPGAQVTIDAKGCAVSPGLIDSHVHPVAGDWTPRQNQLGWIDSSLHGGVTTMISAGEVHTPGRPRDIVGLKAMAITAQRCFDAFRVAGVKLHAGAPVLEHGMTEDDFRELAAAGVRLLGEVGLGGVKDGANARQMVAWARQYGIQSTIHTGGPSIPGSGLIGADMVLEADTDVVGHVNGGHTALPDAEIRCICEGCRRGLELVHNGNERAALYTLRLAREMNQLDRIILGTDGPAGSGVQPLGIARMVSMLSALGEVPAEIAFCFATGNTARLRALGLELAERLTAHVQKEEMALLPMLEDLLDEDADRELARHALRAAALPARGPRRAPGRGRGRNRPARWA